MAFVKGGVHCFTLNFWTILSPQILHYIFAYVSVWTRFANLQSMHSKNEVFSAEVCNLEPTLCLPDDLWSSTFGSQLLILWLTGINYPNERQTCTDSCDRCVHTHSVGECGPRSFLLCCTSWQQKGIGTAVLPFFSSLADTQEVPEPWKQTRQTKRN